MTKIPYRNYFGGEVKFFWFDEKRYAECPPFQSNIDSETFAKLKKQTHSHDDCIRIYDTQQEAMDDLAQAEAKS